MCKCLLFKTYYLILSIITINKINGNKEANYFSEI